MTTTNPEALIDCEVIAELRGAMGPIAFADIAATFCDQVSLLTRDFTVAAQAGDLREVARIAHELIGLAGTMGAPRLVAVARQAMTLSRAGQNEPLEVLAETMSHEATATLEAFRGCV